MPWHPLLRNDNIFFTLHGKTNEADAPQLLSYTIDVSRGCCPRSAWAAGGVQAGACMLHECKGSRPYRC